MKEAILNKLHKYIVIAIRISLVIAVITEIYSKSWFTLFLAIIALILTFIPKIFEKKYKIDIPTEFEILIIFFIYLAIYLGEVQQFYFKFWWWDILLHGISAITLGLIGFVIVISLYTGEKIKAKPLMLCLLSFSFAVAVGAIWEIFEFIMDATLKFNMQKSGLIDTMTDLIVNCVGAFVASILGYLYLKNKKSKLTKSINSFIQKNPKLFKK